MYRVTAICLDTKAVIAAISRPVPRVPQRLEAALVEGSPGSRPMG
jgi:hypothetical protein